MNPSLTDLIELALQAGEILRASFGNHGFTERKGEIDLVTEADKRTEVFILEKIRSEYPSHSVLAEETGGIDGEDNKKWIIDPLDGTTNFVHGMPIFCVSIAFALDNEVHLGVVYDPIRDEVFSAQKEKGAWLNGDKIFVSNTTQLNEALLVTGFPYDRFSNSNNNLNNFSSFALKVRGVRRLGAAALDLCYVGAGRVDGYWEIKLEPWDLAAGMLIAKEAGSKVSRIDGVEDMLTPPCTVLAANPELYKKMLAVLQNN